MAVAESAVEPAIAPALYAVRSSSTEREREAGDDEDVIVPVLAAADDDDDEAHPNATLRPGTPTFEELVESLSTQPNGVAAGFGSEEAEVASDGEGEGCDRRRSMTPELAELLEADFLAEAHLGPDGRPKPLPPLPPDSRGEDSAGEAVPGLGGRCRPPDTRRAKKREWMRLEDALFNVLKHMRETTQQSAAAVGAVSVAVAEDGKGQSESHTHTTP